MTCTGIITGLRSGLLDYEELGEGRMLRSGLIVPSESVNDSELPSLNQNTTPLLIYATSTPKSGHEIENKSPFTIVSRKKNQKRK